MQRPLDKSKSYWPFTELRAKSDNLKSVHVPRISVVIPSYNQATFLEETIRSILYQHYSNIEIIIIDGGSNDGSVDIIKHYSESVTYWVSEKDNGQSDAINKGLNVATGDIVTWLNSDDFYAPGTLHFIAENLEAGVGLYIGQGHKINLERRVVYSPKPKNPTVEGFLNWSNGNNFMQPAAFFSKEAWDSCGPLNEDLNFCMDVDLWIKIAAKFPIKLLGRTLAFAYEHPDAKTTADKVNMRIETLLLSASYGDWSVAKKGLQQLVTENQGVGPRRNMFTSLYRKARRLIKPAAVKPSVEEYFVEYATRE